MALDSFVTLLSAESLEGRVDNVVLERHRKELTCSMRGVPALLAMTRDENRCVRSKYRSLDCLCTNVENGVLLVVAVVFRLFGLAAWTQRS